MVEIQSTCDSCKTPVTYRVSCQSGSDYLLFNGGYHCNHCGRGVDECGFELTEELRQEIIAEEGGYILRVEASRSEQQLIAMRILRELLGLELRKASELLRALPGETWAGTRFEMEFLADKLREKGVPVRVVEA